MMKARTRTRAIIFDLDGTLIDSAPDIAAAVNRYLTEAGWPAQDTKFVEQFIGYGSRKLLFDIFARIGHPTDEASLAAAQTAYLENYSEAPATHTRFFAHVREDLKTLAETGLRLGICTNKPHDLTGRVLEALRLSHLFDAAIGADAVPACKPDPGHLLAVAERMSLPVGSWVYVGDTVVDQNTARAANVPFYSVPWGGGSGLDVAEGLRLTRLSDLLAINTPFGEEISI